MFWSDNYERLLAIKATIDPENIFWCRPCIGSDRWAERGDGRLCMVRELKNEMGSNAIIQSSVYISALLHVLPRIYCQFQSLITPVQVILCSPDLSIFSLNITCLLLADHKFLTPCGAVRTPDDCFGSSYSLRRSNSYITRDRSGCIKTANAKDSLGSIAKQPGDPNSTYYHL